MSKKQSLSLNEELDKFLSSSKKCLLVVKESLGSFDFDYHKLSESHQCEIKYFDLKQESLDKQFHDISLYLTQMDDGENNTLIIDSYEKIEHDRNLWVYLKLFLFEKFKLVILCKESRLSRMGNLPAFFSPYSREKRFDHELTILGNINPVKSKKSVKENSKNKEGSESVDAAITLFEKHPFNQRFYVDDQVKIQFWVDFLRRKDQDFEKIKEQYIEMILASKSNPNLEKIGSNASTVLVKAGVLLCSRDFSNVQVPRADLTGGYFDNTSFLGANTQGTRLANAWLRNAKFDKNISDVSFGELPFLDAGDDIKGMTLSDDRKEIFVCAGNNVVHFSLEDYTRKSLFLGHEKIVYCLNQDDDKLVTGSADQSIRVWDIQSRNQLLKIDFDMNRINAVLFIKDGSIILSCHSNSCDIYLWNSKTGELIKKASLTDSVITCLAYNQSEDLLVTGHEDGWVNVWSFAELTLLCSVYKFKRLVTSVCINQSSNIIASVCNGDYDSGPVVSFWKEKTTHVFEGHTSTVNDVEFSPDLKYLVTSGDDRKVLIWNIESKTCYILRGHSSCVIASKFSVDGKKIISAAANGIIRIWDEQIKEIYVEVDDFIVTDYIIPNISMNLFDGKRMVMNNDYYISLVDIKDDTNKSVKLHDNWISCVDISEDGTLVASGGWDENVCIWDVEKSEEVHRVQENQWLSAIQISSNNSFVAYGLYDGCIKILPLKEQAGRYELKAHKKCVTSIAISKDHKFLVSGSEDKTTMIWSLTSKKEIKCFEHPDEIRSVCISMSSKYIASGCHDGTVSLWDRETDVLLQLDLHKRWVMSVKITSDEKKLITGSKDATVIIYDILSQSCLCVIQFDNTISCLSIDGSFNHISFRFDNRSAQVWSRDDNSYNIWSLKWVLFKHNPNLNLCGCEVSGDIDNGTHKKLLEQRGAVFK